MRNLNFYGTLYGKRVHLKQVQKRTAEKLYNSGETILLQSSNFMPLGVWSNGYCVQKKEIAEKYAGEISFKTIAGDFALYNCTDNETGKYVNYYKVTYL